MPSRKPTSRKTSDAKTSDGKSSPTKPIRMPRLVVAGVSSLINMAYVVASGAAVLACLFVAAKLA